MRPSFRAGQVSADVVRRVLSLSGLDRLISVYPTLEAAAVAGAKCREVPEEPATTATMPAVPDRARAAAADRADCAEELLDWAVSSIFIVGMSLQAAVDLPHDLSAQRITEALSCLDDVVREIRDQGFAGYSQQIQPGPACRRPPDLDARFEQPAARTALLHQRVVRAARASQCVAADTAALLERRADLLGEPGRIDYPTEIKQWQMIAVQAADMAERWEQR